VKDDRLYLHHMLERCRRIIRFIGPGRAAFMASEELQDAGHGGIYGTENRVRVARIVQIQSPVGRHKTVRQRS
jgi:hypothetical protein